MALLNPGVLMRVAEMLTLADFRTLTTTLCSTGLGIIITAVIIFVVVIKPWAVSPANGVA